MASHLAADGSRTRLAESSAVEAPMISVVIPARNEEHTIGACLRALHRQSVGCERMEVIVVVAGDDGTGDVAVREGEDRFGRFEIVRLTAGNKNAALRVGCASAKGQMLVLLDADTELAPDAVAELLRAVRQSPHTAAHGAMVPRITTWVSRYCALNRRLMKDLRFDGQLSGGVIALPRAGLRPDDLRELFSGGVPAADDYQLTVALRQRGWHIAYAPAAVGKTLFPWTLRGLFVSMLRIRRGMMAALPLADAALQAGKSAVLLLALPGAVVTAPRSAGLAMLCLAPLLLHISVLSWRVAALRQRGLGDYRTALPALVALDLLGRSLKLWAFVERLLGRRVQLTFRGERPETAPAPEA
jgi:cellulose synthase/poly-beta-1,6-N-acetylglucosamine synthase-like glycosyltransferase